VKLKNVFARTCFCLALLSCVCAAALADTIKLKNGSVLKGKVIGYDQRKFTIIIYVGTSSSQHVVPADEVESIEFDNTGAPTLAAAPRETTPLPTPAETAPAANPRSEKPRLDPVEQPLITRPADPPITAETTAPAATAKPAAAAAPETASTPPSPGTFASGNLPAGAAAGVAPEGGAAEASVAAERTVSVAAAADWTSTEIRVQRGQRVIISATGEVDLGNNQRTGPAGTMLKDQRKLIQIRPTGALIAVVGDDNDDFEFIGPGAEFTARHNGILFLSVNEGNLKDNNGAFIAKVKVLNPK
jgi:hypothetical protein